MKKKLLLISAFALLGGVNVMADEPTGEAPATGNYYLYNVGLGKYYTTDGWQTSATQYVTLTSTGTNNQFTIQTQSSSNHYLKLGYWNYQYVWSNGTSSSDNKWTIEPVTGETDVYAIHQTGAITENSCPYSDEHTWWMNGQETAKEGEYVNLWYYDNQAALFTEANSEWYNIYKWKFVSADADSWRTLKDKVSEAEALYTAYASKIDATLPFYYNAQTQYEALASAIANAKAAYAGTYDETTDNTQQTALQAAVDNLNTVTPTKPNADKFYTLSLWGAYLNMSEVVNDALWSTNKVTYTYKFEAVEGETDQYYIKDASGNYLVGYGSSDAWKLNKGATGTAWRITPAIYQDSKRVQIENTLRSGYMIYFPNNPEQGKGIIAGTSGSSGYYPYFDVAEATETSVTMRISAAKWSTFVAPFDVTIPADLKAFTVTYADGSLNTTAVETTIPANTPVLIYKDVTEAWSQTFSGYAQSYYNGKPMVGSLIGTLIATTLTGDGTEYLLQKQGDAVGFYQLKSAVNSTANRAYLYMPATSSDEEGSGESVKFFALTEDDATAIDQVEHNGEATEVYTLLGIRMTKPVRGLSIVRTASGKTRKVMVK